MRRIILIILFLLMPISSVFAGSVTLNTYYPAPFGAYDRLRLVPRGTALACTAALEGLIYYDNTTNSIRLCHEDLLGNPVEVPLTGVWTQDTVSNSVFLTETTSNPNLKVGIGTQTPQEQLEITGNFRMPKTSAPGGIPVGVIYSGTAPLLHAYGTGNTFLGESAGRVDTTLTGNNDTGIGLNTLSANTTGSFNTAVGSNALRSNTTSQGNTAIGQAALELINGGSGNTAIGRHALARITGGSDNTAIGDQALGWTIGSIGQNTVVGSGAMPFNDGDMNVAIGWLAARSLGVTSGGFRNIAIGAQSMYYYKGGLDNIAIGFHALMGKFGAGSLGSYNTAVGDSALMNNVSGQFNAAFASALTRNESGNYNIAVGNGALGNNIDGDWNTAIGLQAGFGSLGSGNVFIGAKAGKNELGSNKLYIANSNVNPPLIYGDFATGQVDISSVMRLTPIAAAPACTALGLGKLYVDTSDALCYCNGSGWTKITGIGSCI